jgi:hypothetical protein
MDRWKYRNALQTSTTALLQRVRWLDSEINNEHVAMTIHSTVVPWQTQHKIGESCWAIDKTSRHLYHVWYRLYPADVVANTAKATLKASN